MENDMKKSKKGIIIWGVATGVIGSILLAGTIVALNPLKDIIDIALGGDRANYILKEDAPYRCDYSSKAEVYEAANELNQEVCEDGFVLLKNENGALPMKTPVSDSHVTSKPKVSVFGKNSVNLAYGGTGSGGSSSDSEKIDLYETLESAGYETNATLKAFYENTSKSGAARKNSGDDLDSGDTVVLSTGETPVSSYTTDLDSSYEEYSDMAIVVITRIGGEGFDLPRTMKGATGYRNEDDHFLQLDQNETDLLDYVCKKNFKHVVVVLNTSSTIEAGFLEDPSYYAYQDKIDACIQMGFPGDYGAYALGRILNGEVSPSGKTADTYAADFKDNPTWNNFGDNLITGYSSKGIIGGDQYVLNGKGQLFYFVDYEEGEYVGYRYYETRGTIEGEDWYQQNVVYPFGYGLSYTDFKWEILSSDIENQYVEKDKDYEVKVKVTNIGDVAGKDTVELFGHAPYNKGGIEKPSEVLLDFEKTDLLEPNESETLTLSFDPYYLSSYDYKDNNDNGFKGYELEGGDYYLSINHDAHQENSEIPFKVATQGIRFAQDKVTGNSVVNRYTDQEEYFNSDDNLSTVLSRADFDGTWPTAPTDSERNVDEEYIDALKDTTTNNPTDFSDMELPWFEEESDLEFEDMLVYEDGKYSVDYDDDRWEELLSKCSEDELINLLDAGGFQTAAIASIGKARTNDTDGPAGFTNFMDNSGTYYDTCHYCSETVMACTWNKKLLHEIGEMIGNEGCIGATEGKGNGLPYSGWYAPAVNIHRSPFGGRNFEYFSEDPILSGKLAAQEVDGCQSKGVYCYVKHFALNEQETHRSIGGDCSYVTEQAMREIYLRSFEIVVKEGKTRAMMSSFNRIGTRWTGGDYRLLTEILRNEWGFKGMVITDFNTLDYMDTRQMSYAGGDLNLIALTGTKLWADKTETGDMIILRNNAKNVLYTVGNSNYMNGIVDGYNTAYWRVALMSVDIIVLSLLIVWGVLAFYFTFFKKKNE